MDKFERQVVKWAGEFNYPPTPEMSQRVTRPVMTAQKRPLLAWAMALLIGLMASLLLVPEVRATAVAVIRAGGVTIFVGEPLTPTATPEGIEMPAFMSAIELADAAERIPEMLTSAVWGAPDQIWAYEDGSPTVIVQVWLADDGHTAERVLYYIDAPQYINKAAERIEETRVNQATAFWIDGPHLFRVAEEWEEWRFINSNVLLWWSAQATYRLESYLTLNEAVQAAESLVPLQEVLQDE